jgi:hypothetical protein
LTDVTVTTSTAVVTVVPPASATIATSGAATATISVSGVGSTGPQGPTGATGPTGPAGPESNPVAVRYTSAFTATGLTFTGTGVTAPGYNSNYVKTGALVTFNIEILCTTVTNFGTGQYALTLPFLPAQGGNHFQGWVWRDPSIPADDENHIILNADTVGVTKTLDLHFLVGATPNPKAVVEKQLKQGAPGYNLTTVSKIYINGTYITSE